MSGVAGIQGAIFVTETGIHSAGVVGAFLSETVSAQVLTAHRYWQIYISAVGAGNEITSIAEIQFRTTAGVPLLFSGGTASASSAYDAPYVASMATDSDPSTRWSSADYLPDNPQTWTYDYGAGHAKSIVEITLQARGDNTPERAPSVFTPQWSNDGVTWTSMAQITAAPWTTLNQIQTFAVNQVSAGVNQDLTGDIAPTVSLAGDFFVVGDLLGVITATVQLYGDLSFVIDLAGDITPLITFDGDIDFLVDLASGLDFLVTFGGDIAIDSVAPIDLSGGTKATVTLAGELTFYQDLAGDIRSGVTLGGDVGISLDLVGDITATFALGGDLGFSNLSLAGDIRPQITLTGEMFGDVFMDGDITIQISLSGDVSNGPLWVEETPAPPLWTPASPQDLPWSPIEPCDPKEWEEAELCNG